MMKTINTEKNKISALHDAVREILSDENTLQHIVTTTQAVMPNAQDALKDVDAMLRFYSKVNSNQVENTLAEKTTKEVHVLLSESKYYSHEQERNLFPHEEKAYADMMSNYRQVAEILVNSRRTAMDDVVANYGEGKEASSLRLIEIDNDRYILTDFYSRELIGNVGDIEADDIIKLSTETKEWLNNPSVNYYPKSPVNRLHHDRSEYLSMDGWMSVAVDDEKSVSIDTLQNKFATIATLLNEVADTVGVENLSEVIGMSSSHVVEMFENINANDFFQKNEASTPVNSPATYRYAEMLIDTTSQAFDDVGVNNAVNYILRNIAHSIDALDARDRAPLDVDDINGNTIGYFRYVSDRTEFDRTREGIIQINIDMDHPSYKLFEKTDSIREFTNPIANALVLIDERSSIYECGEAQRHTIIRKGEIPSSETKSWTVGGYGGFIQIESNHMFTSKRQNITLNRHIFNDTRSTNDASL